MYTDERVYDATAKRSGCCLRSLIVIQEVARYHLHNTWARTKSCIIPSSLARLRYRFALYFPFSLGWRKKRKKKRREEEAVCVACVRQSRGSARIYARQQPALSASVRSLLRDAYWRRSGKRFVLFDLDALLDENSRDLRDRVTCREISQAPKANSENI